MTPECTADYRCGAEEHTIDCPYVRFATKPKKIGTCQ